MEAQVDDPLDAVLDERRPAFVAQLAHAVRADDRAEPRLAAVLGRVPPQVADVQAALPGEIADAHGARFTRGCAGRARPATLRNR